MKHEQIFPVAVDRVAWNSELSRFYAANRYALLREFVSPRQIHRLVELRLHADSEVYLDASIQGAPWRTDRVPAEHWLNGDIRESRLIDRINSFADMEIESDRLMTWYMHYGKDSYVYRHTEKEGSILLVICLEGVEEREGGTLHLCPGEMEHRLQLAAGEAVIFSGRNVPHFTSPIVASGSNPDPQRTVLVVRFS